MTSEPDPTCCACGRPMTARIGPWSFRCPTGHAWASTLTPSINAEGSAIDEGLREDGLEAIRSENNQRVLDTLDRISPLADSDLLDVGSAHGWFLSSAASRGARVSGIEPDDEIARQSQHGETVRSGYFPDVLGFGELFDVISFNDVLEHIPHPAEAISACFAHLRPGGLLSINIPDNRGLGFLMARTAARLGVSGPYARLWQKGLPSPHLWYFDADALGQIGRKAGFRIASTRRLPSIAGKGLWQRVHMDRSPSLATGLQFFVVSVMRPLLNSSRMSDILHLVLIKPE